MSLLAVHQLPDGSVVLDDGSARGITEMLREYDPAMSLVRNFKGNRWEVWRRCEDGVDRLMCHYNGTQRVPGRELIDYLYTHDVRKGFDVVGRAIEHNEHREREVRAERHEMVEEDMAPRVRRALIEDNNDPRDTFAMRGPSRKPKVF